mgnify:CR=1 FL=1
MSWRLPRAGQCLAFLTSIDVLVDGLSGFFELCEQGPFSAGLNARVLYALSCMGLIRRDKETASGIRVQVPSTGGSA